MAIEDMGVRLVVENLSGFLTGMNQVNQTVAGTGNNLGSLVSTYEKANRGSTDYSTTLNKNMRPALAAVRSLFYTTTSAIMFFMASQENMSSTMRSAMKVISGFSLVMTTVISLYRVWKAQAALAAAGQWVWNGAVAAGTAIAAAFGITVTGALLPLALLTVAIAAVVAVGYLLVKHFDDVLNAIAPLPDAVNELGESVKVYEADLNNHQRTLQTLNKTYDETQQQLKRLQAQYNHAKDTALGYKGAIKMLEAQLETSKEKFSELERSIADARSELNALMRPRFTGQQEVEDQLFTLEMQIKRARLEQLQGADNQWVIDQLQQQYDILLLQSQIKYDPLTRQATEAAETILGMNEEIAPEDVMARIRELGAEIAADQQAMTYYQNNITSLTQNLSDINEEVNATLDGLQSQIDQTTESLYQQQQAIWAVEDAAKEAQAFLDQAQAEYGQAKPSTWSRLWPYISAMHPVTGLVHSLQEAFGFGGLIKAAHGVLVGERGPEVVSLPAGSMVHPNTYNTSYNITANYTNPQQPQGIALDLEYIRMRSRV
jgi:peptidoglycan hydrolase CwlO-like protein